MSLSANPIIWVSSPWFDWFFSPWVMLSCFLTCLIICSWMTGVLSGWMPGIFLLLFLSFMGFSDSSVGRESTCNAGDPSSSPGSGRSAREGIGYPLQYSWASLVAQLIKNPPAMQETWVRTLDWEDPLEKGKATHFSILAWRIPCIVHGVTKSQTRLSVYT